MSHHLDQYNPMTSISYNDVNDPIHTKTINIGTNGSTEMIRIDDINDHTVNNITANDYIDTAKLNDNNTDNGLKNSNYSY